MSPSEQIDKQIADTKDWRGEIIKKLRVLIHEADSAITEEWKWDTGVFTHSGMVCALGIFKDHVKINFFKGATLKDVHHLLNAGLESKNHRAIDFHENDLVRANEIKDLIKEAVALNTGK